MPVKKLKFQTHRNINRWKGNRIVNENHGPSLIAIIKTAKASASSRVDHWHVNEMRDSEHRSECGRMRVKRSLSFLHYFFSPVESHDNLKHAAMKKLEARWKRDWLWWWLFIVS